MKSKGAEGSTKRGTGLGLTIAKRQIELMGGELDFESEPGVGSRFFFTMSLEPATTAFSSVAEVKRSVTHLAEGYRVKALVADDVPENRDILSRMLSDIGVEVTTADNGQKALEMVGSCMFDIVFMDIRMPVVDGIEAARRVLSEFGRARPKMVAVSASALIHEQERYLSMGFDAFIAKPFLSGRVYDCLASLLHIEYEYAGVVKADDVSLALSELDIPAGILQRLRTAAERHRAMELRSCLDELDKLGRDGSRLAERLYPHIQNYDMEAIVNILSRI